MTTAEKVTYRLEVKGIYPAWDDHEPRRLTEPRPFEGVAVPGEWGIDVYENRPHLPIMMYRGWDKPFSPSDYKGFGPWWYKVKQHRWVKVTTVTTVTEEPMEAP